jgi:hypothetical protein
MRLFKTVPALAVVGALVIDCGSANPAGPTGHGVSGLAITGPDTLLTGSATTYSVTATFADGRSQIITPAWSSSNPDVAAVDITGRLEARAHGAITLTASSDGQAASKTIRLVNNYAGRWAGNYAVNGCDAPPGVCASMEVDVFAFPISLDVTQTGPDQSDIQATLSLPSVFSQRASTTGRVNVDGSLSLAGSSDLSSSGGGIWATFQVDDWKTILTADGMTGQWQQRLTIRQPPSTEVMQNQLVTMKRVSNMAPGQVRAGR